tara:strand:- start:129 stop:569 length:441 start_codon:yes stop_codon:yes gene_type:complete
MFANMIFILLLILVVYTYLIYLLFKKESFKKMLLLSSSILLFFVIIFYSLINIQGYPIRSDLPDKFNLLYVKIINQDVIILVKDFNSASYPRLHILDHSMSLEHELKTATSELKEGKNIIGIINKKDSDNYYGIMFKEVKRNIPSK